MVCSGAAEKPIVLLVEDEPVYGIAVCNFLQ